MRQVGDLPIANLFIYNYDPEKAKESMTGAGPNRRDNGPLNFAIMLAIEEKKGFDKSTS